MRQNETTNCVLAPIYKEEIVGPTTDTFVAVTHFSLNCFSKKVRFSLTLSKACFSFSENIKVTLGILII